RRSPLSADCPDVFPIRVEYLNAMVSPITDGDAPICSNRDALALVPRRHAAKIEFSRVTAEVSPDLRLTVATPDHDSAEDPVSRVDLPVCIECDIEIESALLVSGHEVGDVFPGIWSGVLAWLDDSDSDESCGIGLSGPRHDEDGATGDNRLTHRLTGRHLP